MIRAQAKHATDCKLGHSLAVSHPHLAAFELPCSCDQSSRADARLAGVLREALEWPHKNWDGRAQVGLAVVERAAQEGPRESLGSSV
jgi:hypothetical protein